MNSINVVTCGVASRCQQVSIDVVEMFLVFIPLLMVAILLWAILYHFTGGLAPARR